MKLSLRTKNLEPLGRLSKIIKSVERRGIKVYNLSRWKESELIVPKTFFDGVTEAIRTNRRLDYTPQGGILELKKAWQDYFESNGHHLSLENIVATNGASEALILAFATILDPGDEIIIPEPFYSHYKTIASFLNVKIIPIRIYIENKFSLPSYKKIEQNISEKTKAILICNPNNPTGRVYSDDELNSIVKIARDHNLFIISDEIYREYIFKGDYHSMLDYTISDRSIIIESISKKFSACGSRIGCLVSKNKDVINTVKKLAYMRLSLPTI